ncbi:MAG TPA: hypothetical protein DCQ04_00470 [Actinobacteria bacterium]|mgnify:CR=1 FL=1|nr:hypothetical protein [Actinomycetota bacterium]
MTWSDHLLATLSTLTFQPPVKEGVALEPNSPLPPAHPTPIPLLGIALERNLSVGQSCWALLLCGNPGYRLPISEAAIHTYMTPDALMDGQTRNFLHTDSRGRRELYELVPPLRPELPEDATRRFGEELGKQLRTDYRTVLVEIRMVALPH